MIDNVTAAVREGGKITLTPFIPCVLDSMMYGCLTTLTFVTSHCTKLKDNHDHAWEHFV